MDPLVTNLVEPQDDSSQAPSKPAGDVKPEDDLLVLKPAPERTQYDVSENLGSALTEEAIPAASVRSLGSSIEEDSSEHDTTTPSSSAPPSESGNLDCATHHFASSTAIADLVPELFTENIMAKVLRTAQAALPFLPTAFPEIVPQQDNHDGSYSLREADFWTCGFFPGTMYNMLERLIKYPQRMHLSSSVDLKHLRDQLTVLCRTWVEPVRGMDERTDTHDIGFIVMPALRADWELFGNQQSLDSIVKAAHSLATRYVPTAGAIRSWDLLKKKNIEIIDQDQNMIVIIDSMCNLDLLYYAAHHAQDSKLAEIATTHAATLLHSHLRPEFMLSASKDAYRGQWYSTCHVANIDPRTGELKQRMTAQGYEHDSTWSRGQAWGILGYAETYMWTRDSRFLEAACGLAEYFVYRLETSPVCVSCARYVPLWDFDAPIENENEPLRDSSAGTIAANGMLLLSQALAGIGQTQLSLRFRNTALRIVQDTLSFALAPEKARLVSGSYHQIRAEEMSPERRYDGMLKFGTANNNANAREECEYESKRIKPGLKSGAIDNLHRRIDELEQRFNAQESRFEQCKHSSPHETGHIRQSSSKSAACSILALLAKELPKLTDGLSNGGVATPATNEESNKRRRLADKDNIILHTLDSDEVPPLPQAEMLEAIVAAYFSRVHPWIPMIHQARFLQRFSIEQQRRKLSVVIQAMILAASKFVSGSQGGHVEQARRWVVCTAMETLSLESLQALTILAFDDIGNGQASKAWAVIGSMTRTVEYMGLAQEQEDSELHPFCQAYACLENTGDWTEEEERRRVFWNVFLLDRFCSVTMGWSTSLTSDDVFRRLPCDGHLWRKQNAVLTPYFGIWDKSKGRIGNPIGFISQPTSLIDESSATETAAHGQMRGTPSIDMGQNGAADMSTVGAFAYNIEATESMSRVVSYFLQQKVSIRNQGEISSWLTRFKELDLRLVHWKMLLPQKWKANPNLTRQVPLMDPNLTTAHVTHNTSMILLHQLIAYPPPHWSFRNRLPSTCSAEACYTAGTEIATITEKYLTKSSPTSPVGCQYAFCLFVAARVLLAHWRYAREKILAAEFWSILHSLEEMSRRWIAFSGRLHCEENLFSQYHRRLRRLHERCAEDENFRLNIMDYTKDMDDCRGSEPSQSFRTWPNVGVTLPLDDLGLSLLSPEFNTDPMLDQDFIDMDRVIAFEDGSMFTSSFDLGANGW
ncbi:unnamed protein product [Alternaria sp. RS040]